MKFLPTITILLVALSGECAELKLPLINLIGDHQRNYWLPQQVNVAGKLEKFQQSVSTPAVPVGHEKTVRIAFIYPSSDVSDFWRRSFTATTRRLKELGIQYEVEEFESKQIQHTLQSEYTTQVIKRKSEFDFVIFGPSELSLQADNIKKLVGQNAFETMIWAFHTPLKSLSKQPLLWLDFSSAVGAKVLCKYMLDRLGQNVLFALNRGIPGITDSQRSGDFQQCVQKNGNWELVYEHFGQYRRSGGIDGATSVAEFYPEVVYIHNANTAMTMGTIDVIKDMPPNKRPVISGWGGTSLELQSIRSGFLNMTPMRMNDDVGVATAEAIGYALQRRQQELPTVYLGRISVVHDRMTEKEINDLEAEAFRYSGVDKI